MSLICFSAPDENPTGVQGLGTEHNNLVISWKVISSIRPIILNLQAFIVAQGAPGYVKPPHTAEVDFTSVCSYNKILCIILHSAELYAQLPMLLYVICTNILLANR